MSKNNRKIEYRIENAKINFSDSLYANKSFNESCGEYAIIEFKNIAINNIMSFDCLFNFKNNEKIENVLIHFSDMNKKSFDDIRYIGFNLNKAKKTLGTYSTMCNKIFNNDNPSEFAPRSNNSMNKSKKSNIAILKNNDILELYKWDSKKLIATYDAKNEKIAILNLEFYNSIVYYIDAIHSILNDDKPKQYTANRLGKLIQLITNDENEKIECMPKHYALEFDDIRIKFDDKPSDEKLINARIEILKQCAINGIKHDANKIMTLECIECGGGSEWLQSFLNTSDDFILEKSS